MRIQRLIIGLYTVILGIVLVIIGITLTQLYLIEMAKRTSICLCRVIDIGLFYSTLVNIGILSILFGLNSFLKNLNSWVKSLVSISIGVGLIYLDLIIEFGNWDIDADIKINFIPYSISGILLILGGIILIRKKITQLMRTPS